MERFFDIMADVMRDLYHATLGRFDVTPLEELKYTVVDLETTGFYLPPIDRIVEIGAVRIENMQVVDEFSTLVNPVKKIPRIATEVTGITNDMVKDAPKVGKGLQEFFKFSENTVFVAYNVAFDFEFIKTSSKLSIGYLPPEKSLCSFILSRKLLYFLERFDLDCVADYFNVRITDRHRALGDARATAEIFIHLIQILKKIGLTNYADAKLFEQGNVVKKEIRELLEHYRRLGVI